MKNLFYACGFILILCTYAVNPSSAQYIDDKGEWKFKDTVVLNGTIYAVEKCEKTLFGSCTIGTYQSIPAPIIAP